MWTFSMHGSTDHLDPEVAAEAESDLREKLAGVFSGLAEAGHQGVAGLFHFSHGSPSDLNGPGAPTRAATVDDANAGQVAVGAASDVQVPAAADGG